MERTLLIDGGQSGCRARYEPGGATATMRGLPRRGRDYAALRVLRRSGVEVVAAGLTGFAGEIGAVAAAVPAARVIATNDAVTSHLGALGGEPGVVIVAGTGVIALAAGADGAWSRSDGFGALLGDDGGGYWIGRAGLASALRAADGRGGSADLLERAEARFGAGAATVRGGVVTAGAAAASTATAGAAAVTTATAGAAAASVATAGAATLRGRGIVSAVYDSADPVALVASFARDVADAARAGDATARDLFARAGRELANSALAAARRAGVDGPFSYSGGLFGAGDLLLDPLRDALPELRPPRGDALDGAARLLDRPPLFSDLIHETGAP